jgi:hypothetical protein
LLGGQSLGLRLPMFHEQRPLGVPSNFERPGGESIAKAADSRKVQLGARFRPAATGFFRLLRENGNNRPPSGRISGHTGRSNQQFGGFYGRQSEPARRRTYSCQSQLGHFNSPKP